MVASDSPAVEGESSLAAHSAFANEFLQNAFRNDSIQDSASLEMRHTLASLHHVVDSLKQHNGATSMSYPDAHPIPYVSFRGNELPPIQMTVALIRAAKGDSPTQNPQPWFPAICRSQSSFKLT